MTMIKLFFDGTPVKFETTTFPDGTSQVWKLSHQPVDHNDIDIVWLFENEAELFHVCQLAQLIQNMNDSVDLQLVVPYLPYGRQDKAVSNKATFALQTFSDILYNINVCRVESFDPHSKESSIVMPHDSAYKMPSVKEFHDSILDLGQHDVICYPDAGAASRYKKGFYGIPVVYCGKVS